MPPGQSQGGGGDDTIRIQLEALMGSPDAINNLTAGLKSVAEMMKSFDTRDMKEQLKAFQNANKELSDYVTRIQAESQQRQGLSAPSASQRLANTPQGPSISETNDRIRDAAEANRAQARQKDDENRQRERSRLDQMRDSLRSEQGSFDASHFLRLGRRDPVVASTPDPVVAATPPEADQQIPSSGFNWRQRVRHSNSMSGDIRDRFDRVFKDPELTNIALTLQGLHGLHPIQRLHNFGRSIMGETDEGVPLGYRRNEGGLLPGWLPFQDPTSRYGQEDMRQFLDVQDIRLSGGINGTEARNIVNASAASGFSGDARRRVATEFMAPLFRNFKVDPQNLMPFTQVLRTGSATLGDLTRELSTLGETARNARVDVNTMAQALAQAGEASQAAGGTFMTGVRFGNYFSNSFGITPDVGSQLLQNPMIQGYLGANTGLPPIAQGAASPTAQIQATQQAVTTMYHAMSASLPTQGERTPIKDAAGNVMGFDQGTDAALAATAQHFGISSDNARLLMQGRDRTSRITAAEGVIDAYTRDAKAAGGRIPVARGANWARQRGLRFDERTGRMMRRQEVGGRIVPGARDAHGRAIRPGSHMEWAYDESATKDFNEFAGGQSKDILADDPLYGKTTGRNDLIHAAHEAGVKGKELGDALDKKTPEAQAKAVRQLVENKQAEDRAKYEIQFTGPAAAFFKALVRHADGKEADVLRKNIKATSSSTALGPAAP
jgi:hypothetical protein